MGGPPLGRIVLAFGLGGLALRTLAAHAPASLAADLAQPIPVIFGWRWFGIAAWCVFALTWVAATAFLTRWLSDQTIGRTGILLIAGSQAVTLCVAMTWPAIVSSDIYAYAAFGVRTLAGGSPYTPAAGSPLDAIDRAAAWQWGSSLPPDNYGPLFNGLAAAFVSVAHGEAFTSLLLFQAGASVACVACTVTLWFLLAARSSEERARSTIAFALNPLILWSAAEGHNDFYAIAIVLAGLLLAKNRPFRGGIVIALGALVKAPALLAAAIAAIVWRNRALAFRAGVVTGAIVSCALSLPLLESIAQRAAHPPAWPTAPTLYPWYFAWLVPLLAAQPGARVPMLWASAVAVLAYAPDMFGTAGEAVRITSWLLGAAGFAAAALRLRPIRAAQPA